MKEETEPLGVAFMREVIQQHELLLESKMQKLKKLKTELITIQKEGNRKNIKIYI